ncbi:Phage integrase family protein OS=Bosea thiooxidans OX=53254 GN=SAMN05660750_00170 PE=4 SV=1 [Bosea thiooxidans]
MATVHWPGNEVARVPKRAHLIGVPFIMTGDEEFPDGINAFIFERARGKVSALHGAAPRVRLRPLDREARQAKIAYNLADLLTG